MNARIIELPRITDPRGNLTVCENESNLPFDVKRVTGCMTCLAVRAVAVMPTSIAANSS